MMNIPSFHLDVKDENVKESSGVLPPYSDKIILPPTVLQTIIDIIPESELPHPLIFKIENEEYPHISTYVGVKEFSSLDDEVILPKKIETILKHPSRIKLSVKLDIPKATSLKLRPSQLYSDITNWKYFLESKLLKYYTVLTNRQLLIIEDNNFHYELQIEEINDDASNANLVASIINTDITLDIIPLNDEMANQQLLEFNSNPHNNIIELNPSDVHDIDNVTSFLGGKFIPKIFKLDISSFSSISKVYVKVETTDLDNVDLIGGFDKFINLENFKYTTMNQDEDNEIRGFKYIELDLKSDDIVNKLINHDEDDDDDEDSYKFIYFIPFTWEHDSDIKITITDSIDTVPSTQTQAIPTDGQVQCSNCMNYIEKGKLPLHEAFCFRNNKKCPQCNQVFLKVIPETHWHCPQDTFHTNSTLLRFKHSKLYHSQPYKCQDQCPHQTTYDNFIDLIVEHKGNDCPLKMIQCRFCKLIVPQEESTYQDKFDNLTHHENWCGGRTSECYKCGQILRLKDFKKHLKVHQLQNLEFNQQLKLNFNKCCNENCINLVSMNNINDLNLCEICYGPLYVQQLDPTHIKLQSRIERKYMIQISRGCGNKSWCNNPYCSTSNNVSSEIKGLSMKETLQFINSKLLSQVHTPKLPINKNQDSSGFNGNKFWFCVNESVSMKKILLDVLKIEGVYDEEMIYKAINEANSESTVRQWLKDHVVKS